MSIQANDLTRCSSGSRFLTKDERLNVGLGCGRPVNVLYCHDMVLFESWSE